MTVKTKKTPQPPFVGKPKPFVMFTRQMIRSPTFLKLSNAARVAYLLLRDQQKNIQTEEVKFPYKDAAKFMHQDTWRDAVRLLEEHGFITIRRDGGDIRRMNVYVFSDVWKER